MEYDFSVYVLISIYMCVCVSICVFVGVCYALVWQAVLQ